MSDPAYTLRAATTDDADALARLAQLAGRPRLAGRALIAERRGVPLAALALSSGSVVAHPFHATAKAVQQLRRRHYQLLRQGGDVGQASSVLRRLAAAV